MSSPEAYRGRRVAPSILSADFSRLGSQVAEVMDAGARVIHVDVMDGHFVPPITIHFEATPHTNRTLNAIREAGCLAGLAVNPGTPADAVSELDGVADIVLCMSVNPGWGGQPFIASAPAKIARVRELAPDAAIEVDGGIDPETVGPVAETGATLFVAGSAIFGAADPAAAYRAIAAAAGAE
jgi:ribulose-phosphate 3-epimerase